MKKVGKSEVIVGALITAVAGVIVALIEFGPWSDPAPAPDPPRRVEVQVTTLFAGANVPLGHARVSAPSSQCFTDSDGHCALEFPPDRQQVRLRIAKEGYVPQERELALQGSLTRAPFDLVVAPTPATSTPEPSPTSSPAVPAPEPGLSIPDAYRETRVNLQAVDLPLKPVLLECAKQAGLQLGLDETLVGNTVTIQIENGLLSSVMRNICDAIDCRWEIVSRPVPLLLVTPRQPAASPAMATSPAAEPSGPPG